MNKLMFIKTLGKLCKGPNVIIYKLLSKAINKIHSCV